MGRLGSALLSGGSLVGGFAVARWSGRRELGGVPLIAAAIPCARIWGARRGAGGAAGLVGVQWAAMGLSHPLAKRIGAWPSVLAVSAATAAVSYLAG